MCVMASSLSLSQLESVYKMRALGAKPRGLASPLPVRRCALRRIIRANQTGEGLFHKPNA